MCTLYSIDNDNINNETVRTINDDVYSTTSYSSTPRRRFLIITILRERIFLVFDVL